MNAIKGICVVSIFLLSACAQRGPINEIPLSTQPRATQGQATNTDITGQEKLTTQADTTDIQPIETNGNKKDSHSTNKKQSNYSSAASKISSWELSGAMAARTKNKGWSASLNWIQRGPSQYQIRLSGPIGSGTMIISRQGGSVTLRDGPKTVSSSNGESLLRQQTGISLPVSNLYYWVRGIPAPSGVQGEKRDQAGRLAVLRQGGYTIQYLQYSSSGLPTNIRMQGNGVFIKLAINSWKA